jgi:hypothetical protein
MVLEPPNPWVAAGLPLEGPDSRVCKHWIRLDWTFPGILPNAAPRVAAPVNAGPRGGDVPACRRGPLHTHPLRF